MNKFLSLFLFIVLLCLPASVVGQSTLWGVTSNGGSENVGAIFEAEPYPFYIANKYDLVNTGGGAPQGSLIAANNGKLYGLTKYGGSSNKGVLFEYDAINDVYIVKHSFNGTNGAEPTGDLWEASNGKLYGLTTIGGEYNYGVLFEFDIETNTYTKLIDFTGTGLGSFPSGSLVEYSTGNKVLYGTTEFGGEYGYGTIFKFEIETGTLIKIHDFDSDGAYPVGHLTENYSDGYLYGMTKAGGYDDKGIIYRIDASGSIFLSVYPFGNYIGSKPLGSLLYANGYLYGLTSEGGDYNNGVLFLFDSDSYYFQVLKHFRGLHNGSNPQGSLIESYDQTYLYGFTSNDGQYENGILFRYYYPTNGFGSFEYLGDFEDGFPVFTTPLECFYPTITTQPENKNICLGTSTFLKIDAQKNPIYYWKDGTIYQWQIASGSGWVDLYDDETYFGTTTDSLVIRNLNENNIYRCVVKSFCGMEEISNQAEITFIESPEIIYHPINDTICEDGIAIFEIYTSNAYNVDSYKWQLKKSIDTTEWETLITNGSNGSVSSTDLASDFHGNVFMAYVDDYDNKVKLEVTNLQLGAPTYEYQYDEIGMVPPNEYNTISLSIDNNSVPYIFYVDAQNGNKGTLKKHKNNYTWNPSIETGPGWYSIGQEGFTEGSIAYPDLAFDKYGVPYVAFVDNNNSDKATVMKYDGENWVVVGVAGFSSSSVEKIKIKLDANNVPYVIYRENATAVAMKFDGTTWQNLNLNPGNSDYPDIVIDSLNMPLVVYADGSQSYKTTVKRYNGSSWELTGNAGFSTGTGMYNTILLDNFGVPHVAYRDQSTDFKAYVMKFEDNSWQVTKGSASSQAAGQLSFTISKYNLPWVAYADGENQDKLSLSYFNQWHNIDYQETETLTLPGIPLWFSGNKFRCIITSSCGVETSTEAAVIVLQKVSFTTQPESISICDSGTIEFLASAEGESPLNYQWQLSIDGGSSWSDLIGEENKIITIDATTSMNGYQYRCVVTNVCGGVNSNAATLTVENLYAAAAGFDQYLCTATSTYMLAQAPFSGTGMWSLVSGSASIANPNSPTTQITGLSVPSTAVLRWTVTTACGSTYDDVTITTLENTAQDGTLDCSFNDEDYGFNVGNGTYSTVFTTALQPDGKIIIGGSFTSYNGTTRNYIARLNADGSLDASFNPGAGANNFIYTTALQPDGKIIIGGNFTSYNGTARNRIARLNIDGSLDASFNPGSGVNDLVRSISVQEDGKIIITGHFTSYNGTSRNCITRINFDGSIDNTFNPGSGANVGAVITSAIQPDGKIIIGGSFTSYNGTSRYSIARINTDGSLDSSFDPGNGISIGSIFSTIIQPDGKIIIGGDFSAYNYIEIKNIARINSDGSLDSSFDPGEGPITSSGFYSVVSSMTLQFDGKIIIVGTFLFYDGTTRNNIARINPDGSLDASFNPGTGANRSLSTTILQPDGRIIIGGDLTSYNGKAKNRIARLNADGVLDTGFNPNSSVNGGFIKTTSIQSDGKIIVAGNFESYNGTTRNNIARVNTDGSLDFTFDPLSGASSTIEKICLQPDGKILIGGSFYHYNDIFTPYLARLNTDGSLDPTFNIGWGPSSYVYALALQTDGKIIIGGQFWDYNGTSTNRIARINTDGSIDASFNTGSGANGDVNSILIQPDGRIIISGSFSSYNGIARNRIARLNTNGSLDTDFNPGIGANSNILSSALQSDGKIIIGGMFTNYKGTSTNRIARINTDGSLDTNFNPGTGSDGSILTVTIQADGKIVIVGNFTSYNGTSRNNIARLNADGSLDTGFNPGTGANSSISTATIQTDGKIIIGGSFTSYDGAGRNKVARVHASNIIITAVSPSPACVNQAFSVSFNAYGGFNGGNVFTLELSDETGSFASPYTIGSITSTTGGIISGSIPNVTAGTGYKIRIVSSNNVVISNATPIIITDYPTISTQPTNQEICPGNNTSFSVVSTSGSSYQWEISYDSGSNWWSLMDDATYSGVYTSTLNITNPPDYFSYYTYRCVISNGCGNTYTNNVVVTVLGTISITQHPWNQWTCEGSDATFSVTANNANQYQWQKRVADAEWDTVGNLAFTEDSYLDPSIAISNNGTPYVAFADFYNDLKATVMYFNGSDWQHLGSPGFTEAEAIEPHLAVKNDTAYLAFINPKFDYKVSVMYYTEADGWSYLNDGKEVSKGMAEDPYIAIDNNGVLYLAYKDNYDLGKLTVKRYFNDVWEDVGNQAFTASYINYPNIAFNNSNTPYVAFRDASAGDKASVMYYDDFSSSWQTLGTGISDSIADYVSLAIDINNRIYVAYQDRANTDRASVMTYDGWSWYMLGWAPASTDVAENTTIVVDNTNVPYLSFIDYATMEAKVIAFKDWQWKSLSTSSISNGPSSSLVMDVDNTGKVYVFYEDWNEGFLGTVKSYDGWENIVGATSPTLTLNNVQLEDNNTEYRCIVSNSCGFSAKSNSAFLYVQPSNPITTQPLDAEICDGQYASFYIQAESVWSYQWQVDAGSGFVNIYDDANYSGTSWNYLIVLASSSMNGYKYRCAVTTNCGTNYSEYATLTVNDTAPPAPDPITGVKHVCEQSNATYSIAEVVGASYYYWSASNGASIISGQGTSSVVIKFGGKNSIVSVQSSNSCGSSLPVSFNVVVGCPKLADKFCGTTVSYLSYQIFSKEINNATQYQWQLTSQTDGTILNYTNTNIYLRLSNVSGIKYNTTYDVVVRAYINDGYVDAWTDWGRLCKISTPNYPTTRIKDSYCGGTFGIGHQAACYGIELATNYWWEFTAQSDGSVINFTRGSNSTTMRFEQAGLTKGETYAVRVRPYIDGAWRSFGSSCNITISTGTASRGSIETNNDVLLIEEVGIEETFEDDVTMNSSASINIFPNPASKLSPISVVANGVEFKDRVVTIEVTDIIGKVIYTKEIENNNGFIRTYIQLNNDTAPGSYLINIKSKEGIITRKIVVQ